MDSNPPIITQDTLEVVLQAHQQYLQDRSGGCRADFTRSIQGEDCDKLVLENQCLDLVSFVGSCFEGLEFHNCYLTKCDFTGATLPGLVMRDCTILDTTFAGAYLKGADFLDTTMIQVSFHGGMLEGARFSFDRLARVNLLTSLGLGTLQGLEQCRFIRHDVWFPKQFQQDNMSRLFPLQAVVQPEITLLVEPDLEEHK